MHTRGRQQPSLIYYHPRQIVAEFHPVAEPGRALESRHNLAIWVWELPRSPRTALVAQERGSTDCIPASMTESS